MTITSKKKNWNPWENCQKYALILFWNVYIWHVLDDPIFYGQWTNLHDRSLNGPKHVTTDYLVWSLTMWEIGTVSRLRLCRRSWGLEIHFWRNMVYFRKPHVRSNLLDVQETNFSCAQLNRIRNHFLGCRCKDGLYTRAWLVGSDRYCSSRKYESE